MKLDHTAITKIFVDGDQAGRFRGTGFLVAPDCVLTCAHVLDEYNDGAEPGLSWVPPDNFEPIEAERLSVGEESEPSARRRVVLVKWDSRDLALIRLDAPMACSPVRLVAGLRTEHESVFSSMGAWVVGFSQSQDGQLVRRLVQNWSSLHLDAEGQILLNIQIIGGISSGMSGSPLLVPFGDETVCAGMAQLGGDGRAISRLILSDPLIHFLTANGVAPPNTVPADTCFTIVQALAGKPRFAIVTSLPEEFDAMKTLLESAEDAQEPSGLGVCVTGAIRAPGGSHSIVLTLLPDLGGTSAAEACAPLLRSYSTIEDILMVGIAGGISQPQDTEGHIRLGDVVVSSQTGIVQYEDLIVSSEKIEVRDASPPPSATLTEYSQRLEASQSEGQCPWESIIALANKREDFARPPDSTDRVLAARDSYREVQHPQDMYRTLHPGQPKIHYGRIGAASALMRDPRRRELGARHHKIKAIEREGTGIADPTWISSKNYLVIRGISDYGEADGESVWRRYASLASASYACALLQTIPVREKLSYTTITSGEELGSESLEQVRQLSHNAASDAGVIDLSFGESGGVLKLEQGLYVKRRIESDVVSYVFEKWQSGQNSMVLIVGEAGYGKTSLLWHLYETLPRSQMEPWFLKSASLSRPFRSVQHSVATPGLAENDLLPAIRKVCAAGRQPVLLLDTVDLLLHEEGDRDSLLEYLRSIFDEGCSVIVTCRHQEAKFLQPLHMKPFRVDQYDDQELLNAVERHVRRFYKNAVEDDASRRLEELRESVARGLPLREVCASPLMLRMLFLIYAPDSIPNEIHAYKLYQEYWDKRVQADKRAGSQMQSSTNLEKACCIVALTLLSEGVPEADEQLITNTAEQYGIQKWEIDGLVSCGILRIAHSATLSFFHQTFFEHSAARGMLRFFGEQEIKMLQTRMGNDWSDLFCAPVFEQALLIGENVGPVRQIAETALSSLLTHASIAANTSGLYVYCHRRAVPDAAMEQVRTLLVSASNPVVDFFLQVAPNLPATRLAALFSELDVVWQRKNWPEQQFALALLERLAFREPISVRNFLTTHAVLQFVVESEAANVAERGLVRVLTVLSRFWPTWSLEQFVKLYNGIFHRTGGTDAPAKVLTAIAECSVFLGEKDLAARFDAQVPPWQGQQVSNFDELAHAYGHLWSLEWQARGVSLDFMIADIHQTSDLLRLMAKLEGLANVLLEANAVSDINVLFQAVLKEKTPGRRWPWISILLKRLMIGNAGVADECFTPQVCLLVRQRLVSILIDDNSGRDKDLVKLVRKMMHQVILPPQLFEAIFSPHLAQAPELWLTFDYLGELLAEGYMGKHPAAVSALESAEGQPEQYQELLESTRTRLGVFVQMERKIAEQYLRLTFLLRAPSGLAQALLGIAEAYPGLLQSFNPESQRLLSYLLHSPQGKTRRTGIALWQEMLRLNLTHAPQLAEVFTLFDKEEDGVTRSRLLLIMGLAVEKSTQDIDLLIQRLAPLTASDKVVIQINSRAALISAILRSPSDAVRYGFAVLDLIVQPPTDSKLVGRLGYVLEQLCADSPSAGLEFCRRMLFSEGVAQLGTQSRRTLSFRLRSPVRALARSLSAQERKVLLGFVPDLDHVLGSIIVDAICHEHFKSTLDLLDELLKNPKVSPEIQNLIRKAKYARERTRGGKAWPELYAALRNAS